MAEQKKQKKDQFVALCADSLDDAERLMPMVQQLAASLRKGIILFTVSPDADNWVETLGVPFAALKSDWPSVVDALPTAFNVVLAVTLADFDAPRGCSSHPRQVLKNFRQSKIAYLVYPHQTLVRPAKPPVNVALTLDHQRESKEKLLWASYFIRFCRSKAMVFHHPYTDLAFRHRLDNNVRFMEKIFSSLNITRETGQYDLQTLPEGNQFANPDLKAIVQPGIDLFIALVPDQRDRDIVDLFSIPPALRLLKHAPTIPILFLNQRDDLYIMCD